MSMAALRRRRIVQATAAPPAWAPNLPSGLTLRGNSNFDPGDIGNLDTDWYGTDGLGWRDYDGTVGSVVTAADNPWGASAFRSQYPGNNHGNGAGGTPIFEDGWFEKQYRRFYTCALVALSSNYITHYNREKFFYPLTANAEGGIGALVAELSAMGDGGAPTCGIDLAYGIGANPPVWSNQPLAGPLITKGALELIEFSIFINDLNVSNGYFRAYVGGALTNEISGVDFTPGATSQGWLRGVRYDGTRGGGFDPTPTPVAGQSRRFFRMAWYASESA